MKTEWPADKVERRSVAALTPYARNARTHSAAQVDQIAASIREWGWTVPVLVDEEGGLIAGHGRVLAAQKLGIAEIPVMVAAGWTEAQKRAYILADNKLALNAGWDADLLRVEIGDLQAVDFDISLIGFGDDELAGVSPHLMVTDPPYGVNYDPDWRNRADRANGKPYGARAIGLVQNDGRADWSEAYALFPGDVVYVWHPAGARSVEFFNSLQASAFEIRMQIIWNKSNFPIGRGNYHVKHEPCWYGVRKGKTAHWAGGRKQTTVWDIPKPQKSETGHSTQKPVECMKRPIENNSSPGQAVYEPFSGSGTTIIAGEMTGRCVYAIELSPAYVDVAVERWQNFTGQEATLESSGETFNQLKARRDGKAGQIARPA